MSACSLSFSLSTTATLPYGLGRVCLLRMPEYHCPGDLRVSGSLGNQRVVCGLMYDLGRAIQTFFWRDSDLRWKMTFLVMLKIQRIKWALNFSDYEVHKGKTEPRKWKETFSWEWSLSPMSSHAVGFLEMAVSKLLFFPPACLSWISVFYNRRALIQGSCTLGSGRILMWT